MNSHEQSGVHEGLQELEMNVGQLGDFTQLPPTFRVWKREALGRAALMWTDEKSQFSTDLWKGKECNTSQCFLHNNSLAEQL